jgi:hypothetical protein
VIPVLGRPKQEGLKLETSLGYLVSSKSLKTLFQAGAVGLPVILATQ